MAVVKEDRYKEFYVGAAKLYTLDWVDDLEGASISSVTWTLSSANITKSNETNDATTATVKLTSSVAGSYTAKCAVTTSGGETLVDYLAITVKAIGG